MALALPAEIPKEHFAAGWALLTTLPLIANATPGALLPWYDRAHAQLLVIEVDPGGVGLVEALYRQMERWLELAHSRRRRVPPIRCMHRSPLRTAVAGSFTGEGAQHRLW